MWGCNMEKVNWYALSQNPEAISLLRKNPNNIYKSDIKYSKMDTAGGNPEQRGSDKQNPELEESKIFIKESKHIFKLK